MVISLLDKFSEMNSSMLEAGEGNVEPQNLIGALQHNCDIQHVVKLSQVQCWYTDLKYEQDSAVPKVALIRVVLHVTKPSQNL